MPKYECPKCHNAYTGSRCQTCGYCVPCSGYRGKLIKEAKAGNIKGATRVVGQAVRYVVKKYAKPEGS